MPFSGNYNVLIPLDFMIGGCHPLIHWKTVPDVRDEWAQPAGK